MIRAGTIAVTESPPSRAPADSDSPTLGSAGRIGLGSKWEQTERGPHPTETEGAKDEGDGS